MQDEREGGTKGGRGAEEFREGGGGRGARGVVDA